MMAPHGAIELGISVVLNSVIRLFIATESISIGTSRWVGFPDVSCAALMA
jgi:hypothetical protein